MDKLPALSYYPIEILMGSQNDDDTIKAAGLYAFLDDCKIRYTIAVLSAHRHLDDVVGHCRAQDEEAGEKPLVFMGLAGMKNDLAAIISACTRNTRPVIAAVVPNPKDPTESRDTFLGLVNMPPGIALEWTGYNEAALLHAGIAAARIICQADPTYRPAYQAAVQKRADKKPPLRRFRTSDNQGASS